MKKSIKKSFLAVLAFVGFLSILSAQTFQSNVGKVRPNLPEHTPIAGEIMKFMVNGVDFEMVWIPPGDFLMGSPSWEQGRRCDEGPIHKVTITKGFWLGKTEVTQRLWQTITGKNPSSFKNVGLDAPVEWVTWNECQEFIKALNILTNAHFRLPTEAEWEYACRAGLEGDRYGYLDAIAFYDGNSGKISHPVGQKLPNDWGLFDMLGNVQEWCQDWYGENYYQNGPIIDPTGPASGVRHVVRGGCGFHAAQTIRMAVRFSFGLSVRGDTVGFRLAKTND